MKLLFVFLTLAAPCAAAAGAALTAPLPAFTAHYTVNKGRSHIGDATLSLRRDAGDWVYSTKVKGTSGMASLLGVHIDERSRFRWDQRLPQMISYDYRFDTAFKHRKRQVRVDGDQVNVINDDDHYEYPAAPGMVERHSTLLALAAALDAGKRDIVLTVASRKSMKQQHYAVSGQQTLTVPAGKFVNATHVKRVDRDKGISAWFATDRCPAPIKLSLDGKDVDLQLLDCNTRTEP